MDDDFHITLLSTSSSEYYSNNVTNSFKNLLHSTLNLNSQYKVALNEICFPSKYCMNNVSRGNECIRFYIEDYYLKESEKITNSICITLKVANGRYENVKDLVNAINTGFSKIVSKCKLFEIENDRVCLTKTFLDSFGHDDKLFNESAEKHEINKLEDLSEDEMKLIEKSGRGVKIKIQNRLSRMIGYIPEKDIIKQKPMHANIEEGFSQQIFIYSSDLIQPQIVGHKLTPTLKIISFSSEDMNQRSCYKVFTNECFMQLAKHQIRNISIDLRDDQGVPIPFQDGYVVTIVLHFRKY